MYKIISTENSAVGLTEKPTYIKIAANGSYVLCSEAEATGIAHNGKPYHLLDRDAMDGLETVFLLEVDMGNELAATNKAVVDSTKMAGQMEVAAKVFIQTTADLDDAVALQIPGLFKTWKQKQRKGLIFVKPNTQRLQIELLSPPAILLSQECFILMKENVKNY